VMAESGLAGGTFYTWRVSCAGCGVGEADSLDV
jgi:hypothetical protein